MRVFACFLLFGVFGCSPAVDYSAPGPVDSPPPSEPARPGAPIPSSEVAADTAASELCFSVAPELDTAMPAARVALFDAAAAWGREVSFGAECPNELAYTLLPQVEISGSWPWPYAKAKPGTITLSTHWVENGQMTDKPQSECVPNDVLLFPVLVHEFGHFLGLGHAPKGSGDAMEQGYSNCEPRMPTAAELAATR